MLVHEDNKLIIVVRLCYGFMNTLFIGLSSLSLLRAWVMEGGTKKVRDSSQCLYRIIDYLLLIQLLTKEIP